MMQWRPKACHKKQYTVLICAYSFIQCSSVIWLNSLFRTSPTKPHCDGLRRGQQLLQWLWGQRDHCVTLKSSDKLTERSVAHSMKCVAPGEPYDWPKNGTLMSRENTQKGSLCECKIDINMDCTPYEVTSPHLAVRMACILSPLGQMLSWGFCSCSLLHTITLGTK